MEGLLPMAITTCSLDDFNQIFADIAHFQDSYTTEYHLLMAASVIVMLPVLIVFVIGQRYFVRGIALSGMKG